MNVSSKSSSSSPVTVSSPCSRGSSSQTDHLPTIETCADCHSPSPRWASVNLGIFLCINCASIHRMLGTHKSRVYALLLAPALLPAEKFP